MPSREEIGQWLRQAATVIEEVHDEYLHDDMVVERQLLLDRATQVEAMGQQSDPMLEELAECLGEILQMVANACDERRYEKASQVLQKYQQSKVQP